VRVSGYIDPAASQITLVVLNTATTPATISLDVGELPVLSATAYQTARSSITSDPYQALGNLDSLDDRMLPAESITTYVLNLPEPFDPERLRITRIDHQGDRLALALPAQPGHPFSLWKSITLLEGSWLPVEDAIRTETEDGQFLFTLPSPANGRAFYRVQFDNPDQGL